MTELFNVEESTFQANKQQEQNNKDEHTGMIDGNSKKDDETLTHRLLKDISFRHKISVWIYLCWSFIILVR